MAKPYSVPISSPDFDLSDASGVPSSHPRGRRLLIARIVWLVLAVGLLGNFTASIPSYYAQLLTLCTTTHTAQCVTFQPTTATLKALHLLNISLNTYAAMYLAADVAVSLTYLVVGALIFWRKSTAWWALFFSFALILFGSFGVDSTLILDFIKPSANPPVAVLLVSILLVSLQWGLLGAFLLTFPTGRFAPGWTWILISLWELQVVLFLVSAIAIAPSILFAVTFLLTWGSAAGVQFFRYRRLYNPVQRQQTKWVVFAYMVGVVVNVGANALGALAPGLGASDSPYQLLVDFISVCLALLIPLSIGIAILRFQLWDIDTIINKALVYGSLTGLLGVVYAVLIIGLESLAEVMTRQTSQPIVLVISTLVIAALFLPVRRRIQTVIDRRFYRHKYDAEKTLAAFSITLQSEFNLQEIHTQLLSVVQETIQPAHISLWLAPPRHVQDLDHQLPDSRDLTSSGLK
jgi:hypothetical protein